MNLKFWYKSLVQLCIGMAIGCVGILIYTGKWALLPGWVSALFWAIGWRIEIATRENSEKEANYWKNMWVNSRKIDLDDGFGRIEEKPRYVTQKEIDERKKRIMEFDFTEPKEKKENA
jgi:hypothetical protein